MIEKDYAVDAERIDFHSRERAMQAILDCEADATLTYLYIAQQFVNRDERGLLTYTLLDEPTYNYHLAFTQNVTHELAGIFTKAMYAMPEGTLEEIATQYTTYRAENVDLYTWIRIHPLYAVVACAILFLLGIFIVLFYEKRKRAIILKKEVERADKANKAKSEFLANVSHDIRTSMNAIVGISNLIEEETDISDKLREYTEKIKISSQHLLGLITDVLDMSKIEADEVYLINEPFLLSEQIKQVDDIMSAQAEPKGQKLTIECVGIRHNRLVGYSARIRRILINILSNAVKYTDDGGKVEFTAEELENGERGKASFVFEICDNGIGMTPEITERIFEPFARGEASVTNKVQGTGLGMSIVKSIVNLMDGDIFVSSEPEKGTRVTVTVDIEIDENAEEGSDDNGEEQDFFEPKLSYLCGKNFLCAEDNELNAEILSEILGMYNATCTVCTVGVK